MSKNKHYYYCYYYSLDVSLLISPRVNELCSWQILDKKNMKLTGLFTKIVILLLVLLMFRLAKLELVSRPVPSP